MSRPLNYVMLQIPGKDRFLLIEGKYGDDDPYVKFTGDYRECRDMVRGILRFNEQDVAHVDVRYEGNYDLKCIKVWDDSPASWKEIHDFLDSYIG